MVEEEDSRSTSNPAAAPDRPSLPNGTISEVQPPTKSPKESQVQPPQPVGASAAPILANGEKTVGISPQRERKDGKDFEKGLQGTVEAAAVPLTPQKSPKSGRVALRIQACEARDAAAGPSSNSKRSAQPPSQAYSTMLSSSSIGPSTGVGKTKSDGSTFGAYCDSGDRGRTIAGHPRISIDQSTGNETDKEQHTFQQLCPRHRSRIPQPPGGRLSTRSRSSQRYDKDWITVGRTVTPAPLPLGQCDAANPWAVASTEHGPKRQLPWKCDLCRNFDQTKNDIHAGISSSEGGRATAIGPTILPMPSVSVSSTDNRRIIRLSSESSIAVPSLQLFYPERHIIPAFQQHTDAPINSERTEQLTKHCVAHQELVQETTQSELEGLAHSLDQIIADRSLELSHITRALAKAVVDLYQDLEPATAASDTVSVRLNPQQSSELEGHSATASSPNSSADLSQRPAIHNASADPYLEPKGEGYPMAFLHRQGGISKLPQAEQMNFLASLIDAAISDWHVAFRNSDHDEERTYPMEEHNGRIAILDAEKVLVSGMTQVEGSSVLVNESADHIKPPEAVSAPLNHSEDQAMQLENGLWHIQPSAGPRHSRNPDSHAEARGPLAVVLPLRICIDPTGVSGDFHSSQGTPTDEDVRWWDADDVLVVDGTSERPPIANTERNAASAVYS